MKPQVPFVALRSLEPGMLYPVLNVSLGTKWLTQEQLVVYKETVEEWARAVLTHSHISQIIHSEVEYHRLIILECDVSIATVQNVSVQLQGLLSRKFPGLILGLSVFAEYIEDQFS